MNFRAVRSIYVFEMARAGRTVFQSIVSPVVSTSLYFVVFGAAIGTRIQEVEGVPYGAFIVPGLIMLMILTQSTLNASFGIYFPKFTGTIYELLSAPVSFIEIVIGYVGAAATKSVILGVIILATAWLFVPLRIEHPVFMLLFLVLTAVTFSLLGFIIGIWADGFEQLQLIPLLVDHAADLPRRHVLLDRACCRRSGRPSRCSIRSFISCLGFPLELLRHRRRERRHQPHDDVRVPDRVPRDGVVDFQDRLSAQEMTTLEIDVTATGGKRIAQCGCGALTATVSGDPVTVYGCSCVTCQRKSGSAFTYAAMFPSAAVTDRPASARPGDTPAIPAAGSRISSARPAVSPSDFLSEGMPDLTGISVGCFADPDFAPPLRLYWASRRHRWLTFHVTT